MQVERRHARFDPTINLGHLLSAAASGDLSIAPLPIQFTQTVATGNAANVWMRATLQAGGPSSGTFAAWTKVTAVQTYMISRSSPGFNPAQILFEFSVDAGSSVAASFSATIEAGIS